MSSITSIPPESELLEGPQPPKWHMSEEEFVEWYSQLEQGKCEWVNGEVISVSPVRYYHDKLQWWLRSLLEFYVDRKQLGVVLGPQFVAKLKGEWRSRREPDIIFVAESSREKITDTDVDGPPDLAIEIVSPDSVARDWREKFIEYEAAGVREYWVIDPLSKRAEAYHANDAKSYQRIPEKDGAIHSVVVPGWFVKLAWLWNEPRIDVLAALAELGIHK